MIHSIFDSAQGVIFDKDGTLLDHDATWVAATKAFGLKATGGNLALAKRLLKEQKFDWDAEIFEGGDGVAGNTWPVTVERFRASMEARGEDTGCLEDALDFILDPSVADTPVPLPGVLDLVAALKSAGMKIGLATNDSEAGARAHLKAMGLMDYFDAVVGADSGFGGKPAPGMIEGCAGQMGLKSSEVVMVGDTDRDTLAGQAAGCLEVVAVLNGAQLTASMKASATLILAETRDLMLAVDS